MRIKASMLIAALALLSLPAFAQAGNSEVSVNFTGNFQTQTTGFGLTDAPSDSGGVLVNYRYHFNRWSAVEANYGHTQYSQFYSSGSVTQSGVNEATLAYQFTFGISKEARFHPFVEAGTGALFFSAPTLSGSNAGGFSQNRPVFLYGGGVTYRLIGRLSAQAGYRGLVYKAPDFAVTSQFTNATTQLAEPYAGLTFRF
ncbi:MAG: outer membrane beta-barrel protein [Candidatus Acidiferrales bacterium]